LINDTHGRGARDLAARERTRHAHRGGLGPELVASCPDKNFLLGSNAAQTTLAAIRARQSKLFRPDCKG
jgi:hypothetical protein